MTKKKKQNVSDFIKELEEVPNKKVKDTSEVVWKLCDEAYNSAKEEFLQMTRQKGLSDGIVESFIGLTIAYAKLPHNNKT